jgi:hypothetical protein
MMRRRGLLQSGCGAMFSAAFPLRAMALAAPEYPDGTARLRALLASTLQADIPAGTYIVSATLQPRDGQVIGAAAGAAVTLKASPALQGPILDSDGRRFTARGLVFDGSRAERPAQGEPDGALVALRHAGGVVLERNTFRLAPSAAIWSHASKIEVRGNAFLECHHAIRIDGAQEEGGAIEDNVFTNTAAFGSLQHITAINTAGLVVRGNTMSGAGLREPATHGPEGTWGNSIYIFDSTRHVIERNVVGGNRWSSLVSGRRATHGTVRQNRFGDGLSTPMAMWIEQEGAGYMRVEENRLDGGMLVGDEGGDHIEVTGNTIVTRGVGIDVSFAARDVLIQGNTITSRAPRSSHNGIYLWDKTARETDVRVRGNRIEGFENAIAINNPGGVGTVRGIRLEDNTFANNKVDVWIPRAITMAAAPR